MRQLHVQVPSESADAVADLARKYEAAGAVRTRGESPSGEARDLFVLAIENERLGQFCEELGERVEEAIFLFIPTGAVALETPLDTVRERTRHVSTRSALEIVLGTMQSVGSWRGMLTYAALSGVVGGYAVIFDLEFLLVAAMLIAPVGAPALVTVIGVAVGDLRLVGRGSLRFLVALLVLASAAVLLGLLYGMDVSTATMEQIASLSNWAALIAVVGGAAGAEAQVQSDRDSLVTGTASGFLIAVSLSPPAAVLGLSLAMGRLDYAGQMAFNLLLTFVGVVVGGWATLRLHGVRPASTRVAGGSRMANFGALAAFGLGLLGLLAWQLQRAPSFHKADLNVRAVQLTRDVFAQFPGVRLLEANARFTRRDVPGLVGEALIVEVFAETLGDDSSRQGVREGIVRRLREGIPGVVPYVEVTWLEGQ
jgi:uncharacterized membrane protein